uniref:NADH-ubiquinone oxidoreductase chain 1 n=1 Tax=Pedicinus badii TaxID=430776 RepID=A0A7H1K1B4_9NEOP|nr:NADH dehydrogenase subunit 1 [Pedicinus badii]
MVLFFVEYFILVVGILLCVAFFSLFERQVLSFFQFRLGPNKVGLVGILQPIGDAVKLILKQSQSPVHFSKAAFYLFPILFFMLTLMIWPSIDFPFYPFFWVLGGLWMIFLLSVSVYGVILTGWYSSSKYALLGAMRSISQSISYEIILTTSLFCVFLVAGSLSMRLIKLYQMPFWFILCMAPIFLFSLICFLAEAGRSPYDLAEGESEIVSGYSVEYGGIQYTCLFLSENISLVYSSVALGVLFMAGACAEKLLVILFLVVSIRACVPRFRYDEVMKSCWVDILPYALIFLLLETLMY